MFEGLKEKKVIKDDSRKVFIIPEGYVSKDSLVDIEGVRSCDSVSELFSGGESLYATCNILPQDLALLIIRNSALFGVGEVIIIVDDDMLSAAIDAFGRRVLSTTEFQMAFDSDAVRPDANSQPDGINGDGDNGDAEEE